MANVVTKEKIQEVHAFMALEMTIEIDHEYGPYNSGDGVRAVATLTFNGEKVAVEEAYISVEKA